jgi:plasmid stabilization system protein ParE
VPHFHLTRQAARDLRDIHARSVATWGSARADRYLANIYVVLGMIAANPAPGRLRAHRSAPFLMVAAERHFVIYDSPPYSPYEPVAIHYVSTTIMLTPPPAAG